LSKLDSSKVDIAEGRAQRATSALRGLAEEADSLGLKQLAVECAISEAEARLQVKDYAGAQQKLSRAILQAEKMELRPLLVNAHFLMGKLLRQKGSPAEATQHYGKAVSLLNSLQKEPGADRILQRADLKTILTESDRWIRDHS
jgi:tetratricopeptide (TPR) repeat protein